jgi:hypothetical protein
MAVGYYESNEPALAPIIAKLESEGEAGLAAVIATALAKQSPLLASLEGSLAKAIEGGVDAAITQYGAPAIVLALVDKELHYAAAALGG